MRFFLLGLILMLCACGIGQSPATPKQGSPERKRLMDVLRIPVEKELKQKVVFKIDHLKVLSGWAFMKGRPLTAIGKPIDYKKTAYRAAVDSGAFDDWICALWRKQGTKWRLVRYAIGATDVVWDPWPKEFGAPKSIFPYGH